MRMKKLSRRGSGRAASAALVLLLWVATQAGAQAGAGTLVLRVRHAAAPLSGAKVTSEGETTGTDQRGEARLKLAPGEHRVAVERLGFADTTLTVAIRADAETPVTLDLREGALEGEAVVITAARSGTVVADQPIRVEAVPQEEIEENQTVAPGNISTLMRELPGVRVEGALPGLGGATLRFRGLPGRLTQVLVDGLPLLGAEPDALGLLQIPPVDLWRVEVVKGVASALYGGSALAGVLDLVTKRPDGAGVILANRTSRGGNDLALFLPGRLAGGLGYTLMASGNTQTREDIDRDGWAEMAGYRRVVVRPRLFWDPKPGRSLLVTTGYTAENRDGGSIPGSLLPAGYSYPEALDTRRADVGTIGRTLLPGGRLLSARGAITHQTHSREFGARAEHDAQTTGLAEMTLAGTNAGHTWLAGGAVEHDALRAPASPGAEYAFDTPGLFVQDEVAPTRWLSATGSARADFQNVYGTFVSPRISVLVRPGRGISLRASGGTGWAAPRPLVDEVEAVGLSRLLPLQGLRAERAVNSSLDAGWLGTGMEVTASVFQSRIRHAVGVRNASGSVPALELYNETGARDTRGAEALLHYFGGPLHVLGGYTYLKTAQDDSKGGREWVERVPRHSGELGAILESEETGRIGVEVSYTGKMRLENDPYRRFGSPFVDLNVLGALNVGTVQLFFNASDILNVRQSHYDPLLRPTPTAVGQPATDVWAPVVGRVVNVGMRLDL
jgi:outer membrane receptor for ferrienterochelin and colicins